MKLLPDLDDDALIHILEYLDISSRLQLMSVCKRFEHLIGTNPQFYRDFELTLNAEFLSKADNCLALSNIRRYFKLLKVVGVDFYMKNHQFKVTQALFNKIGSKLTEIWIGDGSTLTNEQFLMLMQQAPNLKQLRLDCLELKTSELKRNDVVKALKNLETLHIENVTNHEILHLIVPSTLKELIVKTPEVACGRFWSQNACENLTTILLKTKSLETLSLVRLPLFHFVYNGSHSNIKNLSLLDLNFPEKSVFENFVKFVKAQKSVSKLQLAVDERRGMNSVNDELGRNNYREIFEHLLNSESLKEFRYTFHNKINEKIKNLFSSANICNPSVKSLEFPTTPRDLDFKNIARMFPNVTHLKIGYRENPMQVRVSVVDYVVDYTSIKFMNNLEKIEINGPDTRLIEHIESINLREFICDFKNYKAITLFLWESTAFTKFAEKNPQLEIVHILTTSCSNDEFKILVNKLPMLTSLKMKIWFVVKEKEMEDAVDLIGQTYERMDHLELKIEFHKDYKKANDFEKMIKKSYPQIKCARNWKNLEIVVVISKAAPDP
jgi:hypothetical protein